MLKHIGLDLTAGELQQIIESIDSGAPKRRRVGGPDRVASSHQCGSAQYALTTVPFFLLSTDGDGAISFDEFKAMAALRPSPHEIKGKTAEKGGLALLKQCLSCSSQCLCRHWNTGTWCNSHLWGLR